MTAGWLAYTGVRLEETVPNIVSHLKFKLYRDRNKEWRWRLIKNGRVIADSGEGYKRKGSCRKMIEKIILAADGATIEE